MDAITATEDLSCQSDEDTELNGTRLSQNQLAGSQKSIIDSYEKVVAKTDILLKELETKRSVKEIKNDLKEQNGYINTAMTFQKSSIDQNQFQCYYDKIIMELNKIATNYIRLKSFDFSKVLLLFCRYTLQTDVIKSIKISPALQVNILNNLGYCLVKQSSSTPFDSEVYFNQNESNSAMKYLSEARKIIEVSTMKDQKAALATNSLNFSGLYCSCYNDHKAALDYAKMAVIEFNKNIKRLEEIEISKSVEDMRRSSNEKVIKQHYKFLIKSQIKVADENFHLGNFQNCKDDFEKCLDLIKKHFSIDSLLFKKYYRKYEKVMKKIGSKKDVVLNDHKQSSSQITPKFDQKNNSVKSKPRPKSALQNRLVNINDHNTTNFPMSELEDNIGNLRQNKVSSLTFDSKSQAYTSTSRKLNKNVAHFNSNFEKIRTQKKGDYNIQTEKKVNTFHRSQQGYFNGYLNNSTPQSNILNNNLTSNSPNLQSAKNFEMNKTHTQNTPNRDFSYISRLREKMSNKIRSASGKSANLFSRNTVQNNYRQNFLQIETTNKKNTDQFNKDKIQKDYNLDSDDEIQQNPVMIDKAFSNEELENLDKSEIEATMYYLSEEAMKKDMATEFLSEQINIEAEKKYIIENEVAKLKKELYIRNHQRKSAKNYIMNNQISINRNETSLQMRENLDIDQSERIDRLEDLCRKLEAQLLERHETEFNSRSQSKTIKENIKRRDSHEKYPPSGKTKQNSKDDIIYDYELKLKQEQEKIKQQEEKLLKSSKDSKFKGDFSRSEIAIKLDEERETLETLENKLENSNKKLILEEQRIKRMKRRLKNDKNKLSKESEEKLLRQKDELVNDYLKRMKDEMEKKLKKNIERNDTEFDSPGSNKKKDKQIIERQDGTDKSFSLNLEEYGRRNINDIETNQCNYNQRDSIKQQLKYDKKKQTIFMHEDSNQLKRHDKEYYKESNQLSETSIDQVKNSRNLSKTDSSSSAIKINILEKRLKTEEVVIKNLEQKLTKEFEDRIKREYEKLNNEREIMQKKEEEIKFSLDQQKEEQKKVLENDLKTEYETKLLSIEKRFQTKLELKDQQLQSEKVQQSNQMNELENRIKIEYESKINNIEKKIQLDYEEILLKQKNQDTDKQTIEMMMLTKEKQRLLDREIFLNKEETRQRSEGIRLVENEKNLRNEKKHLNEETPNNIYLKQNEHKNIDVREYQIGEKNNTPPKPHNENILLKTNKDEKVNNIEKNPYVGMKNSLAKSKQNTFVNQDTRVTDNNESIVLCIESEIKPPKETKKNNFIINTQENTLQEPIQTNVLNNSRPTLRQDTTETKDTKTEFIQEERLKEIRKEKNEAKKLPLKKPHTFVEGRQKSALKQINLVSEKKIEMDDNLTITEDENESFISPDFKGNIMENTPLDILADEMYDSIAINNINQQNFDDKTISNFGEHLKFNSKKKVEENTKQNNNIQETLNSECHKPVINKITDLNNKEISVSIKKIDPEDLEKSFKVIKETNHITKSHIKNTNEYKNSSDDVKTTSYNLYNKPFKSVVHEDSKTKKHCDEIKNGLIDPSKKIDQQKPNNSLAKSSVVISNGEVVVNVQNDKNQRLKTDGNCPEKVKPSEGIKTYNPDLDKSSQKKMITQKFRNASTDEITQNYSQKKGLIKNDLKKDSSLSLSPTKKLMAENNNLNDFEIHLNIDKKSKYTDLKSEIESMMKYDTISRENKEKLLNLQVQAKSQEQTAYPKEEMKKLLNLEKEVETLKSIKNKTKEDRLKLKEKSTQLLNQAKYIKDLKLKNKEKKDDLETKIRSKLDQINKSLLSNRNYNRSTILNNDSSKIESKVEKEMLSRGNSQLFQMKENNKKSQSNLIEDSKQFKLIMKPIKIKMTNNAEINNNKDIYLKTTFCNKIKKTPIKKSGSNTKSLIFDNKYIAYRGIDEKDTGILILELVIQENDDSEKLFSRIEINTEEVEINKKNRRWFAGYNDDKNNTEQYIEMEMLLESSSNTIEGPVVL